MNIIGINGSPRLHGNTATLLEHTLKGARSNGAYTECINLYHLDYKGCRSCFSCKRDGPGYGRCAIHDELEPVLDRITKADALILGTPIYYGSATGEMRSFLERLLFPRKSWDTWSSLVDRKIPVGVIFNMAASEEQMKLMSYEPHLHLIEQFIRDIFGTCESLYVTNTVHVDDYSKYRMKYVDSVGKHQRKKEVFPIDCQNAYSMGAKFAQDTK
jgi:multimeric flavodoxin WrbA